VNQLQTQGVLPVDASAEGVGGLAVGQVLDELKDGDEGEPPGGLGWASPSGVEGGEVVIRKEGAEFVAQEEVGVVAGEGGAGHARSFSGDRTERLWSQRHGNSQVCGGAQDTLFYAPGWPPRDLPAGSVLLRSRSRLTSKGTANGSLHWLSRRTASASSAAAP